jgi:hypothetical protein
MRSAAGALASAVLAVGVAACTFERETGYVEIKTVPVTAFTQPVFYIDAVKLDPAKKGNAVLRQTVGIRKLQVDGLGGQLLSLCEIEVKKNRVTSVTVSVVDRPPRCQCRTSSATQRTCVS